MMNELSVSASSEPAERHIVLLHGYGASKGYFCYNFRPLASLPKVELHALDWLGYGRSTRARLPSLPKSRIERVHVAEEFFCGSLERWRQKRGIENFSIVAHSLGAYLACSYANLYPHCVDRIALVSPASVNRTTEAIPREELGLSAQASPSPRFVVPGWFRWGWERFWSPFEPVRWSGPLGPKLVSMWTSLRFRTLPQAERDALHRYAYAMFNAQGSGEYLLNCFLAPGGVGRWPLVDRIDEFPAESVSTLWMYGQNDWMDPQGGWEAVKKLRSRGGKAELTIIPNSGHHLYLDNVAEFNRAICAFMA